ncbi:hypothetical protein [ANMV-1 virus]|nr:hypothetical protein [ANMV-1 virus]
MVVTVDSTNTPLIHIHGTTADVLGYLIAQSVETVQIVGIWNATVGPTNCVFLV